MEDFAESIAPNESTRRLPDGLYVRPAGRPPIAGYTWLQTRGVWIPGKRLQIQIKTQLKQKKRKQSRRRSSLTDAGNSEVELSTNSAATKRVRLASTRIPPAVISEPIAPQTNQFGQTNDTVTKKRKLALTSSIQAQPSFDRSHSREREPSVNGTSLAADVQDSPVSPQLGSPVELSKGNNSTAPTEAERKLRDAPTDSATSIVSTSSQQAEERDSALIDGGAGKRRKLFLTKKQSCPQAVALHAQKDEKAIVICDSAFTCDEPTIASLERTSSSRSTIGSPPKRKDGGFPMEEDECPAPVLTSKKGVCEGIETLKATVKLTFKRSAMKTTLDNHSHVPSSDKTITPKSTKANKPNMVARTIQKDEPMIASLERKSSSRSTIGSPPTRKDGGYLMEEDEYPNGEGIETIKTTVELTATPNAMKATLDIHSHLPASDKKITPKSTKANKPHMVARTIQKDEPTVASLERKSSSRSTVGTTLARIDGGYQDECPAPVLNPQKGVETLKTTVELTTKRSAMKATLDNHSHVPSVDKTIPPKSRKANKSSIAARIEQRPQTPASNGKRPIVGSATRPRGEVGGTKDQRKVAVASSFHPTSEWKEPHPGKNESPLTLYEKHRRPRPIPTGTVTCSIKTLQQEFRCAICLDYIRKARLVNECLHRFCEQCIEKALFQVGRRNECPICRTFIPSRRSLTPDPSFDHLIEQVLGKECCSCDEEEHQRGEIPPRMILQRAIQLKKAALKSGMKPQQTLDSRDDGGDDANLDTRDAPVSTTAPIHRAHSLVKLEIIRSPDETLLDNLRQPYLTISGDATIRVVESFLKQKLGFVVDSIEIMSMWRGQPKQLHHTTTLQDVVTGMTDNYDGSYMPLFFRGRASGNIQMNDLLILN